MNSIPKELLNEIAEAEKDRGICCICGKLGSGSTDGFIFCSPMCEEQGTSEIKGHNMGLHGYAERCFIVIDTDSNGYASTVFENDQDAKKLLEIRQNAGWATFEIREALFFKTPLIEDGPTIVEKRKGCPKCQQKEIVS